jgi:glutamate carboxypeptidase
MERYLEKSLDDMLFLLKELVNQDSGSHYIEGVNKVGQMIRQQFEQLGFDVKEVNQQTTGNHLVIQHKEAINPSILLIAHMDTVFNEGTAKQRPFTIAHNRAYGPGVIDMKGSHVAIIYAVKALLDAGKYDVVKNIVLLFNSDEEIGSPTSRKLIERIAKGKNCCICLEPARANGALVSARRGGGDYIIKVHGRASHAGIAPEEGANAIEEIAHKIIKLHKLNKPIEGISVNCDIIHGGMAPNVIADYAETCVDIRTSKVEQAEILEEKIQEICNETFVPGTKTELSGTINRPPMVKNRGTIALLDRIYSLAEQLEISLSDVATGGGGDASFTSALGIPTIDGLGPVGGFAHSEKEYLEIPSLVERTLLLAKFLENLTVQKLEVNKVLS